MTIRNLDGLFVPRSVALIGATPHAGHVGRVVMENLRSGGFAGSIMLVNPHHTALDGAKVYPGVESLPETPDLAVLATPAATVPSLIDALGRRGTKAAIVIGAGFGNSDSGRQLTQAMLDAARPHLLRIIGPNCLGALLPRIGLNASFAHIHPLKGQFAFLAQSGAILTSVIDWARPHDIGFSCLISIGEMSDVDFGDLLDYLAHDGDTAAILLYIEFITHARKFMSAARAAARLKPVIAIKAGRHASVARAVASHTGALAGVDAVYDAALRRAGILRVFELDELFAAVEALGTGLSPSGDRLAILTNGGGIGILAADALLDRGGRLAELSASTIAALDRVLPSTWSHGNPVDIVGDAPAERYGRALAALLAEPNADGILVLNCPTAVAPSSDAANVVINTIGQTGRCVLTSWVGEETAREVRRRFATRGIPTYETPERAVRAFMHLANYRRNQDLLMETPQSIPKNFAPNQAAARAVIATALNDGHSMLNGPQAQQVIQLYGIPGIACHVVATAADAAAAAAAIGRPVALKILSPDISHKSDAGGVRLDLATPDAVRIAAVEMLAIVAAKQPEARLLGFSVEEMARRPQSHELIVGMTEDVQFGPVLLFGQGGVAVEVIGDRALALPPLNLALAHELMARTRIHKLLQGYRDRPPADLEAIALTLVQLSQLVIDFAEIAELDINPLIADSQGVVALDARIKVRPAKASGAARLAIRPYPSELEQTVTLPSGARALLRPIRPEDEPALQATFRGMSPQAVRLRFFAPLKELTHRMAARMTQIDYEREMALVLCDPGPPGSAEIYGVVRMITDPDNERAEFAISVRDDMAGCGLGTMLMRRIIDYARSRNVGEIYGDVLTENKVMLHLARSLGFSLTDSVGGNGVLRIGLRLRPPG